jgi:hypothetical protein
MSIFYWFTSAGKALPRGEHAGSSLTLAPYSPRRQTHSLCIALASMLQVSSAAESVAHTGVGKRVLIVWIACGVPWRKLTAAVASVTVRDLGPCLRQHAVLH